MKGSRVLSVKRSRRIRVRGGTMICSRCDSQRIAGSAYCRAHKNEYDRNWRETKRRELLFLRAKVEAIEVKPVLTAPEIKAISDT